MSHNGRHRATRVNPSSFHFQPRPTRNLRKRKRTDLDINTDHEAKRRKRSDTFSERSVIGFCDHCTNPYKLICCKKCHRSWHINCLNKLLLTATQDHADPHDNDNALHDITINMPKTLQLDSTSSNNHNGIENEVREMHKEIQYLQKSIAKHVQPIEIQRMPITKKGTDPSEGNRQHLNDMCTWFATITPLIKTQEALHSDASRKQIVGIFECHDCLHATHKCFICKERHKGEDEKELTQNCNAVNCGKYYHRSCLKDDPFYSQHTNFYSNGNVRCPLHHCWSCSELGDNRSQGKARKTCWYCPRSYHRHCVPLYAELMSVQKTDSDKELQKYPDFRYDLITCCWNDEDKPIEKRLNPYHPKPKDLQFGRDDVAAGIFKWELWDGSVCEFYQLYDDPFSLDIQMVNEYREKKVKQKHNPWPKHFKRIQKSRYCKTYKKPPPGPDYGRCDCVDGCSLDWSCSNYGMDIECNGSNCGSRDESLCENRQFSKTKSTDNVQVKATKHTGFGAFARRELRANQLIIEYVGEVITKQESTERIQELNAKGVSNFYFFQVDAKTVIDGTKYGNESRFLNHSCNANCYTGRWNVKGEYKLGIFAVNDIAEGEQLTYDYQYEVPDPDDVETLARCLCGEDNCRIYLGFNKKKAAEWKETHKDEWKKMRKKSRKKKKKKKKRSKKKRSKKKQKTKRVDDEDSDKENIAMDSK